MVGRREAQSTVDKFQRLACFEAVKRSKGPISVENVASWTNLPVADVQRHLEALLAERRIDKQGVCFTAINTRSQAVAGGIRGH